MKKNKIRPFQKTAQWLVLFWNILSAYLHYEVFHFPIATAILFQIIAFVVEYAVSASYEKQILAYDKRILALAREKDISFLGLALRRYAGFWIIYCIYFLSTYLLRLWILSWPQVSLWIENLTLNVFGQVAQMGLITKDIQRTAIVAFWSSFFFALVIPVSLIWKRKVQRILIRWGWSKGRLSAKKKNQKKIGLRSFSSLHIAVR